MAGATEDVGARADSYGQLARPLRLPKMAEVVAEYIRRDIVTGVLKEGESLPSAAVLIERFGVSKPTIREALRILESETLIEVRRGASGARVQLPNEAAAGRAVGILLQLHQTTLEDVYQARMMFEPPIAGLLARTWDDEDMVQLRKGLEISRSSLSDPVAFAESQADFHQLVVTLAGNQTITLMVRLLDEVIRLHETAVNADREHDPLRAAASWSTRALSNSSRSGETPRPRSTGEPISEPMQRTCSALQVPTRSSNSTRISRVGGS